MRGKIFFGACACLIVAIRAYGIVPEQGGRTYGEIAKRNVFGLRPAVQPPATQPIPPALPKITLTGVSTITGFKVALMRVQPPVSKPGEQAKEASLMLQEGQREDGIEVLEIDEHAGMVRINNSGTPMTIIFEEHPKTAQTAATTGTAQANPATPAANNEAAPPSAQAASPTPSYTPLRPLGSRSLRLPNPPRYSSPTTAQPE